VSRVEVIGDATLYLGDCMEILPTLSGLDVLVSDPPYGIAYASGMGGKFKGVSIANDVSTDTRDSVLCLFDGKPALVFGSWKRPRPEGTKQVIVWEKGDHVGMGDLSLPWRPNTEEIYVLGSGFSGHRGSSVIKINAPSPNFTPEAERFHPTEKPVALMCELIAKCPAGVIVDPFMGGGATGVAAMRLGRAFVGVEINPTYFATACRRIEQAYKQRSLFEAEPVRKPEQLGLEAQS
jgi:DNA modification methylase